MTCTCIPLILVVTNFHTTWYLSGSQKLTFHDLILMYMYIYIKKKQKQKWGYCKITTMHILVFIPDQEKILSRNHLIHSYISKQIATVAIV